MRKITLLLASLVSAAAWAGDSSLYENLLITEIVVTPTAGEMIEIHNKGASPLDLSDVYLTDATFQPDGVFYYKLVEGAGGGGGFADFFARFPDGASIAPGAYQTIALNGASDFNATYGVDPTYELYPLAANATPDMREARSGSINGQGGLSGGEVAILFHWDGASDLVQDIDYVLWGDKNEAVDKTGVSIDGPDADALTSDYLNDTSVATQAVISAGSHAGGQSWQRSDLNEGMETNSGGNGVNGADETSEDFNNTFFEAAPTPNAAAGSPPAPALIINEVDAVSTDSEFIEIMGPANTSANGVTVVLYDGDTDQIYQIIDLDGTSTNASGYLLIGNTGLTPDVTIAANTLQDGADAVAMYHADASNFTIGGAITTMDIMDALVYDSGQADDANLLTLMNLGQAQIDENQNADAANQAMARCPNGSGGSLNSTTYQATTPTPGLLNNLCPIGDYYATADPTNATTLRTSLHEIIDDHTVFPYSAGTTDTWDILSFADEDPDMADCPINDPGKSIEYVWMIYKNNQYCWEGGGIQDYNREHTWPQSYGFSSGALGDNNAARNRRPSPDAF